jgi:hypothetical protein
MAGSGPEGMRMPQGPATEALGSFIRFEQTIQGNRAGQHSIRINDQYRICFVWRDGDAFEAEITAYPGTAGSFPGGTTTRRSPGHVMNSETSIISS